MEIRRKNRIRERLEFFYGKETKPGLTVDVDINTDEIGLAAKRAWDTLGIAAVALEKDTESEEAKNAYGAAVVALFGVIFGDESSRKILDFYEDREGEMLADLAPFFEQVMSDVIAAREARKAQFLQLAERGKWKK